ncbi:ABC transporter substrate-binding protein [Methylobacterium sp. WL30]|jgi:NitT/TauT family transport system substrate-binding protein|uniref:ABC transporter substrate-binding protein n=1 Tax=unclassified Methylobacterium TaxID=2615210 RepID=UPI0011CA678D|nr:MULTISPECIES: ABC transporter substrate-binding protein [unclassified Methylobacterium]TXN42080.1 ABC transporter substrate-binding protein [Methylobacterium sp. WL93]TXN52738.1 ABC transporter substrate-binding protein [Methylobacterium sp. WL119]TXN69101.1 ABC transporter substrate-binding protein [Methylobacterium sp. WL30]
MRQFPNRRTILAAGLLAFGADALGAGSATAQTAPVPVRIGVIPVIGAAPIFVANGEGWLEAAGLKPGFTTFESGPNMIQALASGTIDVYVAGIAPLAVARTKNIDVRVVAATAVEEMVFVAGPKLAPYFAATADKAEAFRRYREKEGRAARLATQPPGSVPNTTLQHWLWQVAKTDKTNAEVVAMGIDATQQALLAGAVDGASIREPALTIVQQRNPAIALIATGAEMFPDQPGTVVAVSGAFADRNPAAVQGLVDALVKATDLLKTDPARAAPPVEKALGKGITDLATIRKALSSPAAKFTADPRVIVEATRKMQAYQVSIGTLDKDVPIDGLFVPGFYEKAIAR